MDLFPTFQVSGCHTLDKRVVAIFLDNLCQFYSSLKVEEQKILVTFLNRHRGKLFWESSLANHHCRKAIKGHCACFISQERDDILENCVKMFRDQADLMESHRQRISFVCYFNKHGANVLNEI
jgi:hypothetical protein